MKRALCAIAALALAACNPALQGAPDDQVASGDLSLLCEAFAHVSFDALAGAYGTNNLREETLPGPEGESYTATVLYPGDTARRLEIVWRDDTRVAPASVSVSREGSLWRGPQNIAIGDDLAAVEAANGRAFQLWGFGWDYGGWVSDWMGGEFREQDNCSVRVRFSATADANGVSGDSAFASDLPAMRAARPTVTEFGLMFPAAE